MSAPRGAGRKGAFQDPQRGGYAPQAAVLASGSCDDSLPSKPDAALLAGLRQHDEEALRVLVHSCGGYVYSKALQILKEPRLAEEVAQDTLLLLWWNPDRFDQSRASVRTFLVMVARYKAIDALRRRDRICRNERDPAQSEPLLNAGPADEGLEDGIVLRRAVSNLPTAKREVIFLAFYRGLTYREVAEVLGIPEGTVKTRIRDALIGLRRRIAIEQPT